MAEPSQNSSEAAKNYEQLLPESIDIFLLSVGPDGHIASLFNLNSALQEKTRSVVSVVGPKPPLERLTIITPRVIKMQSQHFSSFEEKKKEKFSLRH